MKQQLSDQDVLNLLSGLKKAEGSYPPDMIQSRRDMYMKQVAAMSALATHGEYGASPAQPSAVTGSTSGGMAAGKLLELALVIALVVEAAVATYIYRDQIAEYLNSILSPNVEIVASPQTDPVMNSSQTVQTSTALPGETNIVIETPVPPALVSPAAGNGGAGSGGTGNDGAQINSTPNPTDANPGLHLGQTKQPTEDPNSNQKNDGKDTNNKTDSKDRNKD